MYILKTIIVRLTTVCVVFGFGIVEVFGAQVTPHAAIYEVSLGRATGQNAPAGLSGTMVYVVKDVCDGFEQDSSLDVAILNRNGRQSTLRQSFASYEAKDGTSSTFEMQITSDDRIVDSYTGGVDIRAQDGTMTYVRPEAREKADQNQVFNIKQDAQLSLTFIAEVLEQAQAGGSFVSRVVADGLLEDGPNRISAVIGRRGSEIGNVRDPDGLLSSPPWPAQLAYYPIASSNELPSQELRVEIYEGGIVGFIDQNLGDYTVLTRLIDLQRAGACED